MIAMNAGTKKYPIIHVKTDIVLNAKVLKKKNGSKHGNVN